MLGVPRFDLVHKEKLRVEKAVPMVCRAGRPVLVRKGGRDICCTCGFVGSTWRALRDLPGSVGGLVPCKTSANRCRLLIPGLGSLVNWWCLVLCLGCWVSFRYS